MLDALIMILLIIAIGGLIWMWKDDNQRIKEIEARIEEHKKAPPSGCCVEISIEDKEGA